MSDDIRADLKTLVEGVRAYVAWHGEGGTIGFPRRPPGERPAKPAANLPGHDEPIDEPQGPIPPARPAPRSAPVPEKRGMDIPDFSPDMFDARPAAPTAEVPQTVVPAQAIAMLQVPESQAIALSRLPLLREEVASCTKCILHATRTHTVFSRGNPEAALCFVGDAPGQDEDASGIPFVGPAGQLLDRMILAMGLDPETQVYVCTIIKCHPPATRKATPDEITTCMPYIDEQLRIAKPKVIVALGNSAVAGLLQTNVGISKMRGQWKLYKGQTLVMPTYHPSYLLRPSAAQATAKREAWEDLQAVMKELGLGLPPKRA